MGVKNFVRAACVITALLFVAGCADVPREAVTLSSQIETDMAELHRANRELALRYFARSKANVKSFIENEYRPFIVRDTIRRVNLLERLQDIANESEEKAFDRMEVFVNLTLKQIQKTQDDLLEPIETQEREVLRTIDEAFAAVINAQSVVTGYLGSVQRIQQVQDEFLARAGLKDFRRTLIDETANISDGIAEITEKASRGDQAADEALKALHKILGVKE